MAGLRVRDILLQANDFDPLLLYTPNEIPRENEKWETTMPIEDFKAFWHRERTAIQFERRVEGGRNADLLKGDPDALLPTYRPNAPYGGTPGRQKKNDWSFRFSCRRYRASKNLTIDRESVGTGCPVEIRMTKPVGKEVVCVAYKWRHNHDDSGAARSDIPLSRNERIWTKKKAAAGQKWSSIKGDLRPSLQAMKMVSEKRLPLSCLFFFSNLISFCCYIA
jgi:hypothetical protein